MTIPTLLGADDVIGPDLAKLTDIIGTLIDPNAKFNQAMKIAFVQNPELMQKFVDIEKANPGTLKAFGFNDKASDLLSGMQESIPGLQARLLGPKVASELQKEGPTQRTAVSKLATGGETPGQVQADDFSAWFAKEGKVLYEKDPLLFARAARAKFGGGTELEQTTEETQLKAFRKAEKIRSANPMQLVQTLADPTSDLTIDDVNALITPADKQGFNAALQIYLNDRNNDTRLLVKQYGAENDPAFKSALIAARDAFKASGGIGTLTGWFYKLTGGSTRLGTPEPEELSAIQKSLEARQVNVFTNQRINLRKAVEPIVTEIHKGGTESEQLQRIDELNNVLKQNNSPYEAFWNTGNVFGLFNKGLRFRKIGATESTGDMDVLFNGLPPNNENDQKTELTPAQQEISRRLKPMTGAQRIRTIVDIRKRITDKATAEEIIRLGGGE